MAAKNGRKHEIPFRSSFGRVLLCKLQCGGRCAGMWSRLSSRPVWRMRAQRWRRGRPTRRLRRPARRCAAPGCGGAAWPRLPFWTLPVTSLNVEKSPAPAGLFIWQDGIERCGFQRTKRRARTDIYQPLPRLTSNGGASSGDGASGGDASPNAGGASPSGGGDASPSDGDPSRDVDPSALPRA